MMLIGFIWAALAPLSLVLAIATLRWALRRAGVRRATAIAVPVILLPVLAIWLWQRADFRTVCNGAIKPTIHRTAQADGIFLNSGTSNSFGMRYLQEEGFSWIEAPSIYQRGKWVRYERGAGDPKTAKIVTTEIDSLSARYEVREEFSQPHGHTSVSKTVIVDRGTNEILATAGSGNFSGGAMKWVLGAWGMSSCPSAMSSPGDFNGYYHLARNTFRRLNDSTQSRK